MGPTRVIHGEPPTIGAEGDGTPVMRSGCVDEFDRVVDVAAAFEYHGIPYAVWGTMLHFIHGIPVGIPELSFVIEDDRFDDAMAIMLHDDYVRQCFCTSQSLEEINSVKSPFSHFGFHPTGEAHFVDRDCSAPPFQLWRRSTWLPHVDLSSDRYTAAYFPYREAQVLRMRDEEDSYLLYGILCTKPRAFRILTQAQMIESSMLLGAQTMKLDLLQSNSWSRCVFHAFTYIGVPSGSFHYPSLHLLYLSWISPVSNISYHGPQGYLAEVSRVLANSANGISVDSCLTIGVTADADVITDDRASIQHINHFPET